MDTASPSLLRRLQTDPRPSDWARIDRIYRPWMRRILSRDPSLGGDAEDVIQDVMVYVVGGLPGFHHTGKPHSFRSWIRAILHRRLQQYYRDRQQRHKLAPDQGSDFLSQLADPGSTLNQELDREETQFVLKRLMELMEFEFTTDQLRVFRRLMFEGVKAPEVAAAEGVSVDVIYQVKSRILNRLRAEASEFLD